MPKSLKGWKCEISHMFISLFVVNLASYDFQSMAPKSVDFRALGQDGPLRLIY